MASTENPTFQLPPKVLGVNGGTGTTNFCSNLWIEVEGNILFRKKNTNKFVKYYSVFTVQHPQFPHPTNSNAPAQKRGTQHEVLVKKRGTLIRREVLVVIIRTVLQVKKKEKKGGVHQTCSSLAKKKNIGASFFHWLVNISIGVSRFCLWKVLKGEGKELYGG